MSDFKKTGNINSGMTKEAETTTRERPQRKKTYERVRESQIPQDVQAKFNKEGYDLKFVRWSIAGEEDYRYLARREREGYEFVTKDELPANYLAALRVQDTKNRRGLVTLGDLVLMKVDQDLRNDRRRYFQGETDNEVASVDIHVLEKKGYSTRGSKSKVIMKEPTFQQD